MNSQDILNETYYKYSEYIEMQPNPDAFVSGILATRVVALLEHVEYLEKRLKYDSNVICK